MLKKISLVLTIVSVFVVVLVSSLFSQMYNLNYYDKKFVQYNIYEKFSKEQALNATNNILGYFKSNNELDNYFLNEKEQSHLYDVKLLIQKTQFVYHISLAMFWIILILFYLFNKKELIQFFSQTLFYSGLFTVTIIALFSLMYFFTGFDFIFQKFHELFFTGNYAFDSNVSNLKSLFPDVFFINISWVIMVKTFAKAILLILTGTLFRKNVQKP